VVVYTGPRGVPGTRVVCGLALEPETLGEHPVFDRLRYVVGSGLEPGRFEYLFGDKFNKRHAGETCNERSAYVEAVVAVLETLSAMERPDQG